MLATAAAIFVAHLALVQTDTDSSEQSGMAQTFRATPYTSIVFVGES